MEDASMNIDYAKLRQDVLVSTKWLEENLAARDIRIVDTRKEDSYSASHIPGSVSLRGSPFLRENSHVITPESFALLMGTIGVGEHTTMIAYDDGNNLFAGRLWWVARYYGHQNVKILDGGWDAWSAEQRPMTSEAPNVVPSVFIPRPRHDLIASSAYVQDAIGKRNIQLLDVRGNDEWNREENIGDTIAGHIPGARHIVWTDVIDSATKRFRSGDDLHRIFIEAGLEAGVEVIPYCQGGVRAAHTMAALHVAGFGPIRNYEGSWGAWSKLGTEIEKNNSKKRGIYV